jgi:hypothetical protein
MREETNKYATPQLHSTIPRLTHQMGNRTTIRHKHTNSLHNTNSMARYHCHISLYIFSLLPFFFKLLFYNCWERPCDLMSNHVTLLSIRNGLLDFFGLQQTRSESSSIIQRHGTINQFQRHGRGMIRLILSSSSSRSTSFTRRCHHSSRSPTGCTKQGRHGPSL